MTKSIRVQRSRQKGWRMPPNTVKVDRTTKWGNPFSVGEPVDKVVAKKWGWWPLGFPSFVAADNDQAFRRFRAVR